MLNLAAKPFEVARSMSVPFFTWRIVLFFLSIFYYGVYIYRFLLISCFFLNVQAADHFFLVYSSKSMSNCYLLDFRKSMLNCYIFFF